MSAKVNGNHSFAPSGPESIVLYHHAQEIGQLKAENVDIKRRIQKLETSSLLGLSPMQFVQIGIGLTVVGASITGRISWGESLPVIGRLFGG
jgi:hypothetical protein